MRSSRAHRPIGTAAQGASAPPVRRRADPLGGTVFTDAWGSYTALAKLRIDHRPRKGGHGRQALDILPWARTVFGNLKTWLRGTFHGVSPKHLQRHVDEFSYRFDRRWREGELFGFVLRRVVGGQPLPYPLLVAEGTAQGRERPIPRCSIDFDVDMGFAR